MTLTSSAVAGTSGLLAVFNSADPEHDAVVAAANNCGRLIVSPLALTELHYLASVRANRRVADRILRSVVRRTETERITIASTSPEQLRTALTVRAHYAALDLDLVDAVNVVIAAEWRTDLILTLDRRDFRAMRPLTPQVAFRLLPDDA